MKTRALAFVLVAVAAPAWAASDDYRDGRIRVAEPGVTLQRVDEVGAEEAVPNLPFLPGDRVWTDFSGRAEFQFADGSVVRLDTRSKLDYLAHEDGRDGDLIVLSLWSGGVYLHVRDDRQPSGFQVETPEGRVEVHESGVYRVDVERGELRLSVYDGEAVLASGRRDVTVRRGERAWASRGDTPSRPEPFDDEREDDAFARWDRERGDPWAWAGDSRRYLPEEIVPYGADLEDYGSWHHEVEIGYVWRPRVAPGWAPYTDGRWVWTAWGWTWVPHESWGWAPYHYGRWGHSLALGWYWIPDRTWGPAWVSWAVGGDYVGWCPLGWRNRPVVVQDRYRGRAVPRGSLGRDGFVGGSNAWVYAQRDRLGTRDVARRRAEPGPEAARGLRVVDVGHNRLTRELRVVEADSAAAPRGAVPRNIRVRPSPADTVPELRGGDGRTTIPDPALRRGGVTGREHRRYDRDSAPGAAGDAAPRAVPRLRTEPERDTSATDRPARRSTPDRTPAWRQTRERDDTSRARPIRPPEVGSPAHDDERGATRRESGRERDTRDDGDVLRRFFQPLTGARDRSRDDDGRARVQPRDHGDDRADPQAREPQRRRPQEDRPAWQPRDDGAGRRAPERSQPQVERRDPPRSSSGDSGRGGGSGRGGSHEGGATRRQPPPKDHDR